MWTRFLFFVVVVNAQFGPIPIGPSTPEWLQYECNLTGQVITYTQKFKLEQCSCGCSSQYLPCSNNVINDFCCHPNACSINRFQKCFNRQLQCPTLSVQLVLNNINHTAAKSCKCGDDSCLQGLQSFLNMTSTPCWTDGVEFVFENPYDKSESSGLSDGAIAGIVIGSICGSCMLCACMSYINDTGRSNSRVLNQPVVHQFVGASPEKDRRREEEKKKFEERQANVRHFYSRESRLSIVDPPDFSLPDCPPAYNVPNPPDAPPPYIPPVNCDPGGHHDGSNAGNGDNNDGSNDNNNDGGNDGGDSGGGCD